MGTLLILLFTLLFQYPGQITSKKNSEYLIRHYTIEDGLPVNAVNGIVQDTDGYMYFSTYDGLVRYDGYEFNVYNSGNTLGIISNRKAGILQASDGTLWIFNEGGTLTSKKGSVFRTFTTSDLPGSAIKLIEGSDGRIWVAGTMGMAYFSKKEDSFQTLKHPLLQTTVKLLVPGPNGNVYLQTTKGIYALKEKTPQLLLSADRFSYPEKHVSSIQLAGDNKFWVRSDFAAFLFNMSDNKIEKIENRKNSDLYFQPSNFGKPNMGTIFTKSSGFYLLRNGSQDLAKLEIPFRPDEINLSLYIKGKHGEEILIGDNIIIIDNQLVLKGPEVESVMLDKEGSLWMGSIANGLYQIRKSSFINIGPQQIPGFINIYSIVEDRNNEIWACSFTTGIYHLKNDGYDFWNSTNSELAGDLCRSLYEDENGVVYASMYDGGLWKYEENTWKYLDELVPFLEGYNYSIEGIHRQGEKLFIATYNSLVVLENNDIRFFDESAPRALSVIQVFRENSKGVLFVGTDGNGISRIEENSFLTYKAKGGVLNSDTIRDLLLQSDDTLWVVNESNGLNRLVLDEQGAVISSSSVTVIDGLPQNSLHRIIDDNSGYFWISGNSGIMRVSIKELNSYADGNTSELKVLSFNEKDGMINREANGGVQSSGIKASDGRLWFPNQRGITIVNPLDFSVDYGLDVPPPVFESIELDEYHIYARDEKEVIIPENKRNLRVNFTVPNYVNQDRLIFSYFLEGVNERWEDATFSRQAVFTGIPPGSHELIVRSQFIGGSPIEKSMIITIPPYFYETAYFRMFLLVAMMGLVYSGFRIRIHSLKQKEKELEQRVNLQTKELQKAAEEKQRFFTGITHELKTPLSLIIGPLDDLMEESKNKKDSERLSMMQRNGLRLKNLVDQILDVSKLNADSIALKIEPIDLPQFTRQIIGQFQSRLEQQHISIEIPTEEFSEDIYTDREAWERIIINLMSNAIKFSPKNSTTRLTFIEKESAVEIRIKDEGHGIKPEHQQKIFEYLYQVEGVKASEGTGIGLFLVKGLMIEMGGTVELNSDAGDGTEFILTLQKGHSHIASNHTIAHESYLSDKKELSVKLNTELELVETERKQFEQSVLVVEDNYDFRLYLQSILKEHYDVLIAENGNKALKILEKETPNLIISDIMMPKMNGLEFVNTLRSKKQLEHLPVIFLSAKSEDQDVQTGLSTGADIYLTKPIRSSLLLSQVTAILRREQILQNGSNLPNKVTEPEFLRQVREIIFRQLGSTSLNVNQLADALFISRAKLYRDWKKVSEISLNDFIRQTRLEESRVLLTEKGFNVQEAARAVGYSDANYFSTSFKKEFGFPPSELK